MFGTIKDYSLSINSLASNSCLCHRKLFQNDVNPFSNMVNHFFVKRKKKKLFIFYHTILFKFHQHLFHIHIKQCTERIQTSDVSISNGNIKGSVGTSIFAENLELQLFRATVANADTEKVSPYIFLIRTWTTCWQNLNQFVLSEMYKILRFLTKKSSLTIFDKSFDAILKDVSVAETSVQW